MSVQVASLDISRRPVRLARAHPVASAVVAYAAFELVHAAFVWDGGSAAEHAVGRLPEAWRGPAVWAVYLGLAMAPVAILGWWRETGLTRPGRTRGWLLVLLPLAAGLPFLAVGIHLSADSVVPMLIVGAPLIALNEELFFRGFLLELLRPTGWRSAITITAILFGAGHLLNLPAGANLPFTALQVLATTAGGVTLAAIRIRSGSLWPVVAVHAAMDAIALSTLTGAGVDSPLVVPIVFLWGGLNALLWPVGWRLLRGRGDRQLTALYDGTED